MKQLHKFFFTGLILAWIAPGAHAGTDFAELIASPIEFNTPVNLGNGMVGNTISGEITITANAGNTVTGVQINAIDLLNDPDNVFSLGGDCAGATLADGQSCTLTINAQSNTPGDFGPAQLDITCTALFGGGGPNMINCLGDGAVTVTAYSSILASFLAAIQQIQEVPLFTPVGFTFMVLAMLGAGGWMGFRRK